MMPGADSATIVMTRERPGYRERCRSYAVMVDDAQVAKVKRGQTLRLPIAPGRHEIYLRLDWSAPHSARASRISSRNCFAALPVTRASPGKACQRSRRAAAKPERAQSPSWNSQKIKSRLAFSAAALVAADGAARIEPDHRPVAVGLRGNDRQRRAHPERTIKLGCDGPTTLVVGVDGSDTATRALYYALGLARRQHSSVIAVYATTTRAGYDAALHHAQAGRSKPDQHLRRGGPGQHARLAARRLADRVENRVRALVPQDARKRDSHRVGVSAGYRPGYPLAPVEGRHLSTKGQHASRPGGMRPDRHRATAMQFPQQHPLRLDPRVGVQVAEGVQHLQQLPVTGADLNRERPLPRRRRE